MTNPYIAFFQRNYSPGLWVMILDELRKGLWHLPPHETQQRIEALEYLTKTPVTGNVRKKK